MEINWKKIEELDAKSAKELVNGFFLFMDKQNDVKENTSINFNNAIKSAAELSGLIYEERVDTENYGGGYYGSNFMAEYFDWDGFRLVMIEEDNMAKYALDNLQNDEEKAIEFLEEEYPELLIED
jgi:hypothetical protein